METLGQDEDKYRIYSEMEILAIFQDIMQGKSRLTAYFNQGKDSFLTVILAIDEEDNSIIMDFSGDKELNQRLLKSEKIIFVTSQDKIRIQFIVNKTEKVVFKKEDAFKIRLPESLVRLQRREYFRITTPLAKPIKCGVLNPLTSERKELVIADISIGGVALIDNENDANLETGKIYPNCHINLPDEEIVISDLEIRYVVDITLRNGNQSKRYGCRFVKLMGAELGKIQRYIIKLERERNAKIKAVSEE